MLAVRFDFESQQHGDLFGSFLMAYNTGVSDLFYRDRMRRIGAILAKISTPPDPRVKGWRNLPLIGNSNLFEPLGIFAPESAAIHLQRPRHRIFRHVWIRPHPPRQNHTLAER